MSELAQNRSTQVVKTATKQRRRVRGGCVVRQSARRKKKKEDEVPLHSDKIDELRGVGGGSPRNKSDQKRMVPKWFNANSHKKKGARKRDDQGGEQVGSERHLEYKSFRLPGQKRIGGKGPRGKKKLDEREKGRRKKDIC